MISKNKIKYIHSLELKKNRTQEKCFVAEGPKVVGDLIAAGLQPVIIIATDEWNVKTQAREVVNVTDDELRKVSFLQHPQKVMAVFPQPEEASLPSAEWLSKNLCIALDGVQDPGNLGTIIRLADWFGIDTIICSRETADAYAPKVVQATMGSIARVKVLYTSLKEFIGALPHSIPVYGTLLDGDSIYEADIKPHGIIVMGNEGNGITPEIRQMVSHKLLIPSYPPDRETAESLNVAIATAIVCNEFRKRPKDPLSH